MGCTTSVTGRVYILLQIPVVILKIMFFSIVKRFDIVGLTPQLLIDREQRV